VPPPAVCVNGHFASVVICLSFRLRVADITWSRFPGHASW